MKSKILAHLSAFATMVVVASLVLWPFAALASDISQAQWVGIIRVTNNASAAANVSVNFTLPTQPLINDGFVNLTLNNTAVRTGAGADVAYMPAPSGQDAWMIFVPTVAANASVDDTLYTGGTIDMDAKLRYFPGTGGVTTPDSDNLELGSNFTVEVVGFDDTTQASTNLTVKADAFKISIEVGNNITAGIAGAAVTNLSVTANGDFTNIATVVGAATHWEAVDDPPASPDDDTSYVTTSNTSLSKDAFEVADLTGDPGTITSVTIFYRVKAFTSQPANYQPFLRLGGVETAGSAIQPTAGAEQYETNSELLARPGGGDWTLDDIQNVQAVIGINRITTGNLPRLTQVYLQIAFTDLQAISVTAQNVGIGEHTVTVNASEKIFAPANVLKFDGTATSNVNPGALHNAAGKLWVSFWFKLDSPFSSASDTDQYIWAKRVGDGNQVNVRLSQAAGRLVFRHESGGPAVFNLSSSETSWNADQWYHVISSLSSANGARLRVDAGTAITDADTTAAPNGGDTIIGKSQEGGTAGIVGAVAIVAIGTDDLTVAEEAGLFNNVVPADANNLWYIDEGTGTNIIDYGTDGDDGTADSATVWATELRPCKFAISIDDAIQEGFARTVAVVNNANNWAWVENDALPYVETTAITVNATQQLLYDFTEWLSSSTVPDGAGADNDGTATFRTSTTDTDVSAVLLSFLPVTEARATDVSLAGVEDLWTELPEDIDQLYTELQTNHLPGATFINQMLDHAGIPQSLFWFPTVFGSAVILGFIAYWLTRSLLIQSVVSGMILALASLMTGGGVVPFWTVIVFIIEAVAVMWVTRQRAVP